ncbi:MAG: hypothetical protein LBL71_02125 [Endomicrobium sp.]|nr:hypothetical protein [Endomicrobium sp.]
MKGNIHKKVKSNKWLDCPIQASICDKDMVIIELDVDYLPIEFITGVKIL